MNKKEFYKELEDFGNKKIREVVKDLDIRLRVSVDGRYNFGSFGSKTCDTFEINGWTLKVYKDRRKRVYLDFEESKKEEYEKKIQKKNKEIYEDLLKQVKIEKGEKMRLTGRLEDLKVRTGAEEVEENYVRGYKDNRKSGIALRFGDVKVIVGGDDMVNKIVFDDSETKLESVLKLLKLGKFK